MHKQTKDGMEHTGNENIAEALKLLDHAAHQKKDELKSLMSDKYTNLRGLIVEAEGSLMKSLTDARDHARHAAVHAKDVGVAKVNELSREVDQSAHTHPWTFIGASAVVGLLLGFILARSPK